MQKLIVNNLFIVKIVACCVNCVNIVGDFKVTP